MRQNGGYGKWEVYLKGIHTKNTKVQRAQKGYCLRAMRMKKRYLIRLRVLLVFVC